MFFKIGIIILALGLMMGDSDCLAVPVATILIGAAMVYLGKGENDND